MAPCANQAFFSISYWTAHRKSLVFKNKNQTQQLSGPRKTGNYSAVLEIIRTSSEQGGACEWHVLNKGLSLGEEISS